LLVGDPVGVGDHGSVCCLEGGFLYFFCLRRCVLHQACE